MNKSNLNNFELVVRRAILFTEVRQIIPQHPFDVRDIETSLPIDVRELFDNGHYSQATFEAFKFLDNEIKRLSGVTDKAGKDLIMHVFRDSSPLIALNPLKKDTDKSEQEGYKFLFAGSILAIRNPRGHEHSLKDDINTCLDHLSLVSMLIRRLRKAGYH